MNEILFLDVCEFRDLFKCCCIESGKIWILVVDEVEEKSQ